VGAVGTEIGWARRTIEAPFLQLALQRVWQEDERSGAPHMRTDTLNSSTVGGVLGILRQHLQTAVGALDSEESLLAARMFRYLVTPSGGKNATSAHDLAALRRRARALLIRPTRSHSGNPRCRRPTDFTHSAQSRPCQRGATLRAFPRCSIATCSRLGARATSERTTAHRTRTF
jgi:hypothetical protein